MLLVTGATGNVGQAVLAALADKPVAVRAFVRDPSRLRVAASNIEVVRGDLADSDSLERALKGVDAAFLASGFSPRMAELHTRFVAAAKKTGVGRLVQLSGVGANSGLCCARALRWLGQVEGSTQSSGMQVTHLRPTFYMQNLLQFAPAVAEQNVIAGPFRGGKWTFVDARDVGAVGAATLLDPAHAGRTYTVTGSESISYEEVASRMGHILGKPIRYVDITANEARGRLQAAGAAPVMIEATLELWDACASNLINVAPTHVVRDITGQDPRSFDDFLRDYRHAFA
jgi:uncharacterized protein YbjT (DUF2867 family)